MVEEIVGDINDDHDPKDQSAYESWEKVYGRYRGI